MNHFKTFVLGLSGLIASVIFSQSIDLYFPRFEGKTYDFIIFQGDKQVKAMEGTIPKDGNVQLFIPEEYAPYNGTRRWLITN